LYLLQSQAKSFLIGMARRLKLDKSSQRAGASHSASKGWDF